MKKTIGFTIKGLHNGFFSSYALIEIYITDEDGRTSLGEYLMTSESKYRQQIKMESVRDEWVRKGYLAVGDWS